MATRRQHNAAFKAKVAVAAPRGDCRCRPKTGGCGAAGSAPAGIGGMTWRPARR